MAKIQRQQVVEKHEIPGTGILFSRSPVSEYPYQHEFDSDYVFRKELVQEVGYCLESGANCMLVGDTGFGKSSLIVQLACQLHRPLVRLNLNGESDTQVLLGRDYPGVTPEGVRQMIYRRAPLARAVELGYWILLDEIDAALQPVLFCLQQVLEEGGSLVLDDADGTVISKHPNTRIFATANTVGIAGAHKLLYSGTTHRLNEATLDRFNVVIHVPHPDPDLEELIISRKVPDLDSDFVKAIVRIAVETRRNLQDDRLSCTFSTRRCIDWARAMRRFHPLRAAKLTVLNKVGPDDAKVLEGVIQRFFGNA